MNVTTFIKELEELLEVEDIQISEETELESLAEWDSLAVLSMIAFIDEHFSKQFKSTEFDKLTTVTSLVDLIGRENFAV